MIATLRRPRWLALAAVTVLLCTLFWWLGTWQWSRWEDRTARNDAIEAALAAPPAPLTQVMPDPARLPSGAEHRAVTVTGRFAATAQVLQRNPDGRSGYAVLTPLVTDSGTFLVERGFVPPSPTDASAPAQAVDPPAGEVSVTARLRAPEQPSGRQAPAGQVYEVDPELLAGDLPSPVYAAYGELVAQVPASDPGLTLPEPASTGMGPNLFYAIQWWLFIGIAVVGYVTLLRRESSAEAAPSVPVSR